MLPKRQITYVWDTKTSMNMYVYGDRTRSLPFKAFVRFTDLMYSLIVRTPYLPVLRTTFSTSNVVHTTERLVHNVAYVHAAGGGCQVLCLMRAKAYPDDTHV